MIPGQDVKLLQGSVLADWHQPRNLWRSGNTMRYVTSLNQSCSAQAFFSHSHATITIILSCQSCVKAAWRVHIDGRGAGATATGSGLTCQGLMAAGQHRVSVTHVSVPHILCSRYRDETLRQKETKAGNHSQSFCSAHFRDLLSLFSLFVLPL